MPLLYRVAIIEDNPSISDMYKLKLEKEGFDVAVAHDGASGYDLIKQFNPHVALVDIMMPKMGGDEMLTKVRKQPWGDKLRVIILTNISTEEAPDDLLKLDVSRYVVKASLTPQQVVDMVNEIIEKR